MLAIPRLAPSRFMPSLESKLDELTLYDFHVELDCLTAEVATTLEENPLIPGVILKDQGRFVGMLSRQRFLNHMSRRYGLETFLKRPIQVLYQFASVELLVLPGNTLVVTATQQSLQRSPQLLYEPIVVETGPDDYRLLDVHHLLIVHSQIHELATQLLHEQTQAQMLQTEKMASLGRMIAGVAHEILNPVNFIWGNLGYLSTYSQDLLHLLSTYEDELNQPSKTIEALKAEMEFDFLVQDMPQVIESMKIGAERLKKIVGGLRSFSHMDESSLKPADIHECIDHSLLILSNRLKCGIEVIKNYGDLPLLNCYSGSLSQVFVNIIGNAIDALMEQMAAQPKLVPTPRESEKLLPPKQNWQPRIEITTEVCAIAPSCNSEASDWIAIRICDNGPGISPEIQAHIFETFFTTKPVGKGTGLGLAISHQIVTEKHRGQLNLSSQLGAGTQFEILLPQNL